MPIEIKLNVAALERLMGGDDEACVKLRTGVVAEFAKRYFKQIVQEEGFQEFVRKEMAIVRAGLDALVNERVGDIKKVVNGYATTNVITLRDGVKVTIEEAHFHGAFDQNRSRPINALLCLKFQPDDEYHMHLEIEHFEWSDVQ